MYSRAKVSGERDSGYVRWLEVKLIAFRLLEECQIADLYVAGDCLSQVILTC